MINAMYLKHEAVLQFLLEEKKKNPSLTFTFRKSNRFNRLTGGHWFYGNDNYLALSFWSGSDWKNKTPNIIFVINEIGETSLDFTAIDSKKKASFFQNEMLKTIKKLEKHKQYLHKDYLEFETDYIESLKSFLNNDKLIIDEIIRTKSDKYFTEADQTFNRVGFIEETDFQFRLKNVLKYRKNFKAEQEFGPTIGLRYISIKNIFPIKDLQIPNIPSNSQWVFITGMNGTGKSSILKGITTALLDNVDSADKIYSDSDFEIEYTLQEKNKEPVTYTFDQNTKIRLNAKLNSTGFASYGAIRLSIHELLDRTNVEMMKKVSLSYSMFHTDGLLLSIREQYLGLLALRGQGKLEAENSKIGEERINQIIDLLPVIVPSLINLILPANTSDGIWEKIKYIEEDENGEELEAVDFDDLASGIRSLIAMFSDMLLRLFAQQKDIDDPSELKGIVIIDEIDIHLHPVLQKQFVKLLSGVLPNVQFIVSTHSPIPLLGAPKNSVVYNVTRSRKEGVKIKQLTEVDFTNMLPNTMLTSPIFGMDELAPESNSNIKEIISDNNYNDTEFFKIVEKRIDELSKEIDD
jgi:predicted ATPase